MEQGVLTRACNPNTWGARVGEPGVHAPLSVLWKSSHGGGGPANLLMEEDTSFKAPYLFLEVVSWKKRTCQSSHGGSLFLWLMKKIYIWSGCRKKSPLWRLIGFRSLWKQIDPSYSLLARLITSVAAQSHYWALFFFFSLRSVSQLNSYSWSLLRVVLWTLLSDLLCCPFLFVSFNDFM